MFESLAYLWMILWGWTPEWSENWKAFPHCNGQAACWMHITSSKPWCRCTCGWCRIARKVRRLDTAPTHHFREQEHSRTCTCLDYPTHDLSKEH